MQQDHWNFNRWAVSAIIDDFLSHWTLIMVAIQLGLHQQRIFADHLKLQ